MSKQAYREPAFDDSDDALNSVPAQHTVRLKIKGLTAVYGEDGIFELSGVKPRPVDHATLIRALGAQDDDELMDKVLATIWKFDMVRVLTDRIVV
jgi:hypothetical protein